MPVAPRPAASAAQECGPRRQPWDHGTQKHTQPRSGDRRSAIIKIALSPLPGAFQAHRPLVSPHGCRRGPHSCARPGGLRRL